MGPPLKQNELHAFSIALHSQEVGKWSSEASAQSFRSHQETVDTHSFLDTWERGEWILLHKSLTFSPLLANNCESQEADPCLIVSQ